MEQLDKAITEVAEYLNCGFDCYIHKQTFKVIQVFDADTYDEGEHPYLFEEIKSVEDNPEQYYHIEKMPSFMAFGIMEDFVDFKVENEKQQESLRKSLALKHPFRSFKDMLHRLGIIEEWYKYKQQRLEDYVRKCIW